MTAFIRIWECEGCGRTTTDPLQDAEHLHADGFLSCCPERVLALKATLPEKIGMQLEFVKHEPYQAKKPGSRCWVWTGRRNRNGYGRLRWRGREPVAHRLIWELIKDPIPYLHVLDHDCKNRPCCNPDHLEPVTGKINTHRGDAVLFKVAHKYAKERGRL